MANNNGNRPPSRLGPVTVDAEGNVHGLAGARQREEWGYQIDMANGKVRFRRQAGLELPKEFEVPLAILMGVAGNVLLITSGFAKAGPPPPTTNG